MDEIPAADYPFDAYVNKRAVAQRHRAILFGFFSTVAALPLLFAAAISSVRMGAPDWVHLAAWLLFVAAHTYTILQGFLLKWALGENTFFCLFFAACIAIPIANLIALVFVNSEATSLLRRSGLRIGFLGVGAKDYDRRFSPWLCHWCDYDLTYNRSGICPECGNRIPTSMLPILARRESDLSVTVKSQFSPQPPAVDAPRDRASESKYPPD